MHDRIIITSYLGATLAGLLFPFLVVAQSAQQTIRTEPELASALCAAKEKEPLREQLLNSHTELVDEGLWRALTSRAAARYYDSSPVESFATYGIAIEVATRINDKQLLARTYYDLGRSYSGSNQLKEATAAYETSREFFEQLGRSHDLTYVLADLGLLYFIQENYDKAASYSERSLRVAETAGQAPSGSWPDDFGRATALATLAEIDLRVGDHEQSVQKFRRSLSLYQQLNRDGSRYDNYIAGELQALGRVYTASGDYQQSLVYLNEALTIVKRLGDPDSTANLLNSIGVLYLEQEDYAQAKNTFENSLQLYLTINNKREGATVLLNLGVIEQRQSNYDQALSLFSRSLEMARASDTIDIRIAAGEGVGVVLAAKKDFSAALAALNECLKSAREIGDATRETEITWRLAQTQHAFGKLPEAAASAQTAVALAQSAHSPKLLYLATTTLGQIYAAQNKTDLASETLKRATSQLERMRDRVAGSEIESQLFFEDKTDAYESLVEISVKQNKLFDALVYAERAKGRVLLDVLRGHRPDVTNAMSAGEKAESQRLNLRISEINQAIKNQQADKSRSLDPLYVRLDAARLQYRSFQDSLFAKHPELRIKSAETPSLTSQNLAALSNANTSFLEYVVGKNNVVLFVITKSARSAEPTIKAYPLNVRPEDLIEKVNQFHDALANQRIGYASDARQLYSLLIAPAEQDLKDVDTVCIVPDSTLWNLPFQALMTGRDKFLIEEHAVYYAPSLSVLKEINIRPVASRKPIGSLIAFGNPVIGKDEQQNSDLCPLPEAEQEVSSIANSFSSHNVLIGREATEKTFKSQSQNYSIIHLATHGIIDNRQPLYSHLLLTRTEGDPENDGRLEARQIMDMNLHADLAVLSACETANGRIAPGEGVIGLSWAFFVAGTRATLVSQWKINSSSTTELMGDFYKSLNSPRSDVSGSNSRALRSAALTMIHDKRYGHPFYW